MTGAVHATVQVRETAVTCGGRFLNGVVDGVVTAVKGIAHHFFPLNPSDSTMVRVGKVGVRVAALALAGLWFYFNPISTLVAAVGLVALGLLFNKLSHVF